MALPYQRTGDLQKAVQQIITNLAATTGAAAIGTSDGTNVQADITGIISGSQTLTTLNVSGNATIGGTLNGVTITIPTQSVYTATGAFSTVEKYVSPATFSITGGMTAGQAFRITLFGTCTSSVGNTTTFKIKYGANGTTADATIATVTFGASNTGTNTPFRIDVDFIALTIGGTGTGTGTITLFTSGNGTGITAFTGSTNGITAASFANNVTGILGLTMTSGAVTTTFNVLAAYSEVVR